MNNNVKEQRDNILTLMLEMFKDVLHRVTDKERQAIWQCIKNNSDGAQALIDELGISGLHNNRDLQHNSLTATIVASVQKERDGASRRILDNMKISVQKDYDVRRAQQNIVMFFQSANIKLRYCKPSENRTTLLNHLINTEGIVNAFELIIGTSDPELIIDYIAKTAGIQL
ncbi:hypothetical protein NVP2275O_099 [Vibrio phage 2.275.O._10N.286.54.E11]|nr:hypothetical protein NVP2275O_099 [Vibrio phage 2.275.O._10N.286.54.E11]